MGAWDPGRGPGPDRRPRSDPDPQGHPAQLPRHRALPLLAGVGWTRAAQYIVTNNNEERPFSRDQRRWIYSTAKRQSDYYGFGTDNDLYLTRKYLIVKQSTFPLNPPSPGDPRYDPAYPVPSLKVMGEARSRRRAFRPASAVNLSGMSFGSLSARAVEALNRGARIAGCLHNTGEGGVSPHHRHGGDLVWQIGTGYFGCRGPDGGFSLERFLEVVEGEPRIRAIEIKISQGAKPGLGGIVTGREDHSRDRRHPGHTRGEGLRQPLPPFHLLRSGRTPGLGGASGRAHRAAGRDQVGGGADGVLEEPGPADGQGGPRGGLRLHRRGRGGTGAAPLVFADHVSLPFKIGFRRVHRIFREAGLDEGILFIGSGKLGFPASALHAFSMGCDMISLAREPMLAIGCIQAQRCHTGGCPTGVATQNAWLVRGLDPGHKSARCANYIVSLRKELLQLAHACGFEHPAQVTPDYFEVLP